MKPQKLFGVIALAVMALALHSTNVFSQNIGVNNPTPDASALLDLTSTTKGFLIPRMTSAQRVAIAGPATGLLVFDTSLGLFYYYSGVVWTPLSGSSVTADNGLSIVPANNVRLGGSSLLMNTEVGLNNFNMAWNGQGSMTIGTNVPASGFLLTLTPNTNTWRSGISMTLTNAFSTAYGLDVTTGNSRVNGIRVTHSSAALNSSLYGIGSILSSTNIVSGYLGYRTGSGNTYGVFGITGTNAAYVSTNASTWAGFFQGRTVISGESAPTSALGTDLEVRNTTLGVGNPATLGLRQNASVIPGGSPLGRINFGDNYSATTPQAQILAVRGNTSSSAADVPTTLIFSTTPDGSNLLTERMRIMHDGNVGIGTAVPAVRLHIMGSLRIVDGTQAAGRVMRSDVNGTGSWQTLTASDANAWSLTGNAGTVDGTNFLGTTDNVPLNFKVNNTRAGRIESGGGTYLGYEAGNMPPWGTKNTGIGYRALFSLTSGYYNTAIGAQALAAAIGGYCNTAMGVYALTSNQSGYYNSSLGYESLRSNSSGHRNTAIGSHALVENTTGWSNSAVGYSALTWNISGIENTALGMSALGTNQGGNRATAIGFGAMQYSNSTTVSFTNKNVAIGYEALRGSGMSSANTGNNNTATGYQSVWSNVTGDYNSGYGTLTLYYNTTGNRNTAIGYAALYNNNGANNTSVGVNAMYANQSGNWNTAIGTDALFNNVAGNYATAMGYGAMGNSNNTSTSYTNYNVAMGYQALMGSVTPASNTGNYNSAIGFQSLYSNSSGSYNTGLGVITLSNNTTGHRNTAIGYAALINNTTGAHNTATGTDVMFYNQTGNDNTAYGFQALFSNRGGHYATAVGYAAMKNSNSTTTSFYNYNVALGFEALKGSGVPSLNTGNYNTALGARTLDINTSGSYNSSSGYDALGSNTTGGYNTSSGYNSLGSNTTGYYNTSVGAEALRFNTSGSYNTAVGRFALDANTTQNFNTAVGYSAGDNYYSASYGTFVGSYAYPSTSGYTNISGFGNGARPTASSSVRIGNTSVTSIGGYAGWTNLSDARFKMDVNENVKGLEFIMKLRPVTYHLDTDKLADQLKEDMTRDEEGNITIRTPDESIITSRKEKSRMLQTGFIAQEVEAAAQSVGFDFSGVDKPKNDQDFYGLRYAEFTVPLVKAVQEQQQMIDELREAIQILTNENRDLKNRISEIER